MSDSFLSQSEVLSPDLQEAALRARQQAVALAYDAERGPPRVVAKGRGILADAIIERAKAHGVYVHESRELVALLIQVDLDKHIPTSLYRAVAELLAWLHYLDSGYTLNDRTPPKLTLPDTEAS
jgi:flagellar biosynthesis protein